MNLDKAIVSRKSIRSFKTKKVKWKQVIEAIDAARKSPFAGNNNNLSFIIIQNPETISKLSSLSDQPWIQESNLVVVACSDDSTLEKIYFERGNRYARQQSGAAIQNFLLKITDLGLSTCWVGAYSDELVKQLLKIPDHIQVEAILPIGYANEKPKASRKSSLEKMLYWENWNTRKKPTKVK